MLCCCFPRATEYADMRLLVRAWLYSCFGGGGGLAFSCWHSRQLGVTAAVQPDAVSQALAQPPAQGAVN